MATMKVVASVEDERHLDAGWWFYLKPGWKVSGYNTHCIHRDTKRECMEMLKYSVERCECETCFVK